MLSRIERVCREKGLRMTGQRRVVAQVLSEASDHPDVEQVYQRAIKLESNISIATVYRTVRLFEERDRPGPWLQTGRRPSRALWNSDKFGRCRRGFRIIMIAVAV